MHGFFYGHRAPRWSRPAVRTRELVDAIEPTPVLLAPEGGNVTVGWGDPLPPPPRQAIALWWVSHSQRTVGEPATAERLLAGGPAEHATHAVNWLHAQMHGLHLHPGHLARATLEALCSPSVRQTYAKALAERRSHLTVAVTAQGVRSTLSVGCSVVTDAAAPPPRPPSWQEGGAA
ncbi:hypothetical protein [Streptomyces chrestomyceticus]|uniref:hypothetical protein n=1 Tax=Streptomyces chrestomyceticus TaxID=68185 RepID=UPI0033C8EB46